MLTATDSLIQYLSSYLGGTVPVHWRRITANDENSDALKMDHLNIQILGFWGSGTTGEALISLDLLGSDERTVLGHVQAVQDLLAARQFAPEFDYSASSPTQTGRGISWDGNALRFISVRTPRGQRYVHYNLTLPVRYTRN